MQQARFVQQFEGAARMALGKHLSEFVANALAADLVNFGHKALNGREGRRIDRVFEARGKADGAQHTQLIFAKAPFGIADGTNQLALEIFAAADEVEHAVVVERVHEQAVDGEIAALYVFARIGAVGNLVRMAAIGVDAIIAEGRNFDCLVLGGFTGSFVRMRFCGVREIGASEMVDGNQHNSELCADGIGFGEDAHYLLRDGIGCDIVIGGFAAEQQVADASAHQVCLVSVRTRRVRTDLDGGLLDHKLMVMGKR